MSNDNRIDISTLVAPDRRPVRVKIEPTDKSFAPLVLWVKPLPAVDRVSCMAYGHELYDVWTNPEREKDLERIKESGGVSPFMLPDGTDLEVSKYTFDNAYLIHYAMDHESVSYTLAEVCLILMHDHYGIPLLDVIETIHQGNGLKNFQSTTQ